MKEKPKQDIECNFHFAAPNGQKSHKITAHLRKNKFSFDIKVVIDNHFDSFTLISE